MSSKSQCQNGVSVKKDIFKQSQNLTRRGKSITNGRRLQFYSIILTYSIILILTSIYSLKSLKRGNTKVI